LVLYFLISEKLGDVDESGEEHRKSLGMLKFTAKKKPDEDSESHLGECSDPFTLPTPEWKLAIHTHLSGPYPHAGLWLKRSQSAARSSSINYYRTDWGY
jgi:hypothetical protein